MKIKIDRHGGLWIFRRDAFREQVCPYDAECGDWCPLFNLEEVYEPGNMSSTDEIFLYNELSLCHGKIYKIDTVEYEDGTIKHRATEDQPPDANMNEDL